jgi:hypothetical protein
LPKQSLLKKLSLELIAADFQVRCDVGEDAGERADLERIVRWNRDVML